MKSIMVRPFLLFVTSLFLMVSSTENIPAQQTAKTDDGRIVLLFGDGTYEWVQDARSEEPNRFVLPDSGASIEFTAYDNDVPVEYFGPDDGFRYVAVEVFVDNTSGSQPVSFNI
ncbi:MAG: hypothetical protein PF508_22495 [Spirochaeta sp.]|nr:hypothetical protein [Spirochaeta sp.]